MGLPAEGKGHEWQTPQKRSSEDGVGKEMVELVQRIQNLQKHISFQSALQGRFDEMVAHRKRNRRE